jgi:hypothetical protein
MAVTDLIHRFRDRGDFVGSHATARENKGYNRQTKQEP